MYQQPIYARETHTADDHSDQCACNCRINSGHFSLLTVANVRIWFRINHLDSVLPLHIEMRLAILLKTYKNP